MRAITRKTSAALLGALLAGLAAPAAAARGGTPQGAEPDPAAAGEGDESDESGESDADEVQVDEDAGALAAAEDEGAPRRDRRRAAQARAAAQQGAGEPLAASQALALVAELDDDPILLVDAAEAALIAFEARALRSPERALTLAREATLAIDGLRDAEAAELARRGLDRALLNEASARAQALVARAGAEQRRRRALRSGRGEVTSGGVFAALGLAGVGIMAGGLFLEAAADRELARAGIDALSDLDPALQRPFAEQYERASTMTASGAVIGGLGLALGGALIGVGVRDLRRAGWRPERRASIRAAPTLGGVMIGGRF